MKRELALHFGFLLVLLILVIVFKGWFNLSYWPLLVGGILGTILPDIDHLIYIYFLAPQELTSQRVDHLVQKKDVARTLSLLYETRSERKNLIFHTFYFQIIFWILAFWVISSSGSVLGRGLVLAFSLHLIVDQVVDFRMTGGLENWLSGLGIVIDNQKTRLVCVVNIILLLIFSILL